MTKSLEDLLDLPTMYEEEEETLTPPQAAEAALVEQKELLSALSNSEKVDLALTSVTGLLEHDNEMDDIAAKAITSFNDLTDLGKNVPDMHIGKIYEVASSMLKTAMEAKDAKVAKKLKILDLQIKKMKIDNDISPDESGDSSVGGSEFDRNELLKHIIGASNTDDNDK